MYTLGSGPQDLGQFIILHVDPALRESIENEALRKDSDELVMVSPVVVSQMAWERCWQEYILGGLGCWL